MSRKSFLLIAEANTEVGLGSITRCVRLAHFMLRSDPEVSVKIITNKPHGSKFLKKSANNLPNEIFETVSDLNEIIKKNASDAVSLIVTDIKLLDQLSEISYKKLIVLGEVGAGCKYDIDLYVSSLLKTTPPLNKIKDSIVGPEYHFLHIEEGFAPKYKFNNRVENVVVSMGGADYRNLTVSISGVLFNKLIGTKISVSLGSCTHRVGFNEKRISGISDDIEIDRQIQVLSEEMLKYDLAITKPGVTCYELMAIGVPILMISTNDNHREIASHLANLGAVEYIGHWDEVNEELMGERILGLVDNPKLRQSLSQNASNLIDGKGLERVSKKILSLF